MSLLQSISHSDYPYYKALSNTKMKETLKSDLKNARISSLVVKHIMDCLGVGLNQLMQESLPFAAKYSMNPISNYSVGAIAAGEGDYPNLYLGANTEFATEVLSFSVHAEQSAINNAWISGESKIKRLAVNAPPCGYCRQYLTELDEKDQLEILVKSKGKKAIVKSLEEYLPSPFGPKELGVNERLLKSNPVKLPNIINSKDRLYEMARLAASKSYSPYTENYSGVIILHKSNVFEGRYSESVAYNPSLSPLESAVSMLNLTLDIVEIKDVTRVILVEKTSKISQKESALNVISPLFSHIKLEYIKL